MKKILVALVMLGILSSCEKFLDVNPSNKAYEDQLFSDRNGFSAALAGVYETLSTDTLYGLEMKYGFMETLVGSYVVASTAHKYYRSNRHEYNFDQPRNIIDNIWGKLYQTINQTNIILEHVDRVKDDPYYNLIKGEAIGLRAFSHFQLLKLFGPSIPNEGIDAQAIPYRNAVLYSAVKFSSAAEVIHLLEQDLLEARTLLAQDPIRSNPRNANLNRVAHEQYNSLIDYRGVRMNYYAIVALQAMVAQWKGDLPKAGQYAEELITELNTTLSIRMALPAELTAVNNQRTPMENIFGLYSNRITNLVRLAFVAAESTANATATPFLFPNYPWLFINLYTNPTHGSLNDFRLAVWFIQPNAAFPWKLSKYLFDPLILQTNQNNLALHENKVISLHTIYMIAAESYATTNPTQALAYLNVVRNARNIVANIAPNPNMTSQQIEDLIFDEMRKENIGEGYLFTEYKRRFRAIDRPTPVQPSRTIFRLPIPAIELSLNPQN